MKGVSKRYAEPSFKSFEDKQEKHFQIILSIYSPVQLLIDNSIILSNALKKCPEYLFSLSLVSYIIGI